MEEKDVTQESSTETEVVNEVPKTDQQEQNAETQSETQIIPSPEVTGVQSDVDEFGVPYKNRYMEMKRKYEDVS